MGCCASERSKANAGQNPTVAAGNANTSPNNPAVAASVNPSAQPHLAAPHVNHLNPSSISVGAHLNEGHQHSQKVNQSGIPGSHLNSHQAGNNSGIHGVQQINSIPYGKEHESKFSAHHTSNIKSQNLPGQSYVSQLHNENQPRLVELDHAKEFAAHNKSNFGNSRVHEKVHGEEQVLQTYHENFEIPIFEVALTAH